MYENLLADVPTDLWIGGKWRKASDHGRFDVFDPATENTRARRRPRGPDGVHGDPVHLSKLVNCLITDY
jgi:hypothetical protein